ncbi:MAG: lytic murein transglycosylase [Candidatus Binatia bacterium]
MRVGAGGTILIGVLALALGGSGRACAEPAGEDSLRGWRYLVEHLVADGLPRERVEAVFRDPRVEPFTGLEFSLAPREPHSMYRGFLSAGGIARARRCQELHRNTLDAAERDRGVPAGVVAAILTVESGCGQNTGSWVILPRLARLAMAAEPSNLEVNVVRHQRLAPDETAAEVADRTRARGRWLWDTFYPEVRATFALADRVGADPLDLRGSISGALGLPQFLPTSVLEHGLDGNGDGHVSVFDADDAIASCADYLVAKGWRPELSVADRRRVIWEYNHSAAYIDTVLALASALDGSVATAPRRATPRRVGTPRGATRRRDRARSVARHRA